MHVVSIPLAQLRAHPKNTHGKDDVSSLAASIQAHGLLAPLVVTAERDCYTILAGHRRAAALRQLGRETAPCHVLQLDDASRALEVLLTENLEHAEADPIREAQCVDALLRAGLSVRQVADDLQRPVSWVAQRRAMCGLSEKVLTAFRSGALEGFTVRMLAMLATVAPEVQEEILDLDGTSIIDPWSETELARQVSEHLRTLGKAPWDVEDAAMLPEAGACSACPKTSIASPGLFDDGEQDGDLRKATCRDSACWHRKQVAFVERRTAELREKHKDLVLVRGQSAPTQHASIPKGALNAWEYERAKKGDKGAVPALVVHGAGTGSQIWIHPPKGSGAARAERSKAAADGKAAPAKAEPTTEERVAALERRRRAHIIDNVRDQLAKRMAAPGAERVMPLLVVYGCSDGAMDRSPADGRRTLGWRQGLHQKVYGAQKPGRTQDAWCRMVWDGVRVRIAEALTRHNPESLDAQYDEADWLCRLFGISIGEHRQLAEAAIPTPKVLAAELSAARPAERGAGDVDTGSVADRRRAPRGRAAASPEPARGRWRRPAQGKAAAAGERQED